MIRAPVLHAHSAPESFNAALHARVVAARGWRAFLAGAAPRSMT